MAKDQLQWMDLLDRLRSMIRAGRFPDGRMPSEPEIAQDLNASRGTVRRALAHLEHEGIIIRKHGSGTFINQAVLQISTRMDEVWDFADMIRLAGYEPAVEHIETRLEPASNLYRTKLHLDLDSEAEVIAATNLFLADRQPVIYCLDVIPGHLVRQAYAPEELHGPVYAFLQRRCHQRVSYNITDIHAVNADQQLALFLKCRQGAALHYFDETGFNSAHQPIIYSQEYYIPEVFCFQSVRRMMPAQIRSKDELPEPEAQSDNETPPNDSTRPVSLAPGKEP